MVSQHRVLTSWPHLLNFSRLPVTLLAEKGVGLCEADEWYEGNQFTGNFKEVNGEKEIGCVFSGSGSGC